MKRLVATSLLFFSMIPAVFAHSEGDVSGFMAGLSHPVFGMDHLLAMVSVGIVSAQIGGRAIWTVPTTFVLMMLVGGLLGVFNVPLISVEFGIAFSVVALGVAIALHRKLPVYWVMLFVGLFAIFHGHAHGSEMEYNLEEGVFASEVAQYAAGFMLATALLHIAGVFIGVFGNIHQYTMVALRVSGVAIAAAGCFFFYTAVIDSQQVPAEQPANQQTRVFSPIVNGLSNQIRIATRHSKRWLELAEQG